MRTHYTMCIIQSQKIMSDTADSFGDLSGTGNVDVMSYASSTNALYLNISACFRVDLLVCVGRVLWVFLSVCVCNLTVQSYSTCELHQQSPNQTPFAGTQEHTLR